jgi:hypothetical protein
MSALGQKQTFAVQYVMSALPPKADICSALIHVRFVPIAHKIILWPCPGCPFRKSYPDVLMMQSGQDRNGDRLAADDHLVQALATQCADQTFRNSVLPR